MNMKKMDMQSNLATLESYINHPWFELLYKWVIKELLVFYTKRCVSVNPERHKTIGTQHDIECLLIDVLQKIIYNISDQVKLKKMDFQRDNNIKNFTNALIKQVDRMIQWMEVTPEDLKGLEDLED